MPQITAACAFLLVIIAFAFAGNDDYEHEKIMEHRYQVMVCAGYWPDYNKLNPDCSEFK